MPRARRSCTSTCVPISRVEALTEKLGAPRGKQSLSTFLRKAASLAPVAIGLLQESQAGKLSSLPPDAMAALIKAVPVRLAGVADIAKAISTAGGIAFDAIDAQFMLRQKPGTFVGRRDARLGGADRRLSVAGMLRHRRGRRAGRA